MEKLKTSNSFEHTDPITTLDLRVFEAMPGNSILVAINAPHFSILAVTAGMLQRSGLSKSEMLNKSFFEPFPANPSNPADPNKEVQNIVLQSFEIVLSSRATHKLPVIRYDLEDHSGIFTECYWSVSNKPVLDSDGNVLYIIHTSEDITTHIKAADREESLKIIEKEHKLFLQAPIAIQILKGADLIVEFANEPTLRIWDKGNDVIGKPLREILPELVSQGYIELIQRVRETGQAYEGYEIPATLFTKGATMLKYFNLVCQPYYEEDKTNAVGVLIFVIEVTDKIIAKKELKESHSRFQAAIEAIQGILWTNSPEGRMEGEQKGWALLTGQSFEEYQDYGWAKAVHPEDAQLTIEAWKEAVGEKKVFVYEHRVRKKNGAMGIFSIRAIPLFDDNGHIREWVGVHTDITEQQEAAQNLRESEQRFRKLADDCPMFVFIIEAGPAAPVSYWNKAWLDYTGQSMQESLGRAWDGIIHPDDVSVVMEYYIPAFQKRAYYFIPSVRVKDKHGNYRWHAFKGNPRYLDNGEFNGYVGVGFDIHEQKVAEESAKQSEARALLAMESARLGSFEIDVAAHTMHYSDRAAEIFGFDSRHQWTYDEFINAIHLEDMTIRQQAHLAASESGELLYESRVLIPDGTIRHVRINGRYLNAAAGSFLIGTLMDITAEKEATKIMEQKIEERTRELKKVNEQLTQFAYFASHDLQEPLRKISVFLNLLLNNLGTNLSDDNKKIAERIQQTTHRMRTLINDLLAYSNTTLDITDFHEMDLNEIIRTVIEDLDINLSENSGKIHVATLPVIKGDHRQMRQLFQNLIGNGLKYQKQFSIPEVSITSSFIEGRELQLLIPQAAGDLIYCNIQVKDNGIGFSEDQAGQIFKLFTRLHTKTAYEGTGIGLAIVQRVVENHKGYILAKGVEGEGAIFSVYLPTAHL